MISEAEGVDLFRYLDALDGETLGYLAVLPAGRALWCGEVSLRALRRQPPAVQASLGNDHGWFVAERGAGACSGFDLLAKAASEEAGLRLLRDMAFARLHAEGAGALSFRPAGDRVAGAGEPPLGPALSLLDRGMA